MKQITLFFLLLTLGFTGFSQIGIRIRGYVRDVSPGIVPKGTREDGKPIEPVGPKPTYLVFLTSPVKHPITIHEMWIHGERMGTRIEPVTKTPVILPNNTGKSVTLVSRTSNKVQQVVAIPFTSGKEFSLARKKAQANELVVVYKQNGKYYSAVLKNITRLEPQFSE